MSWADAVRPLRIVRIAIVVRQEDLRDVVVQLGRLGIVEPDLRATARPDEQAGAVRNERATGPADQGPIDRVTSAAIGHRNAAILVGWTPRSNLGRLREELSSTGASVVELPRPAGIQPPTAQAPSRVGRPFRPLVDTYATVPYADMDPAMFAGLTYVLMFGMMFGDVAHGLILASLGLYLRTATRPVVQSVRSLWAILAGAGVVSAAFGVLYGECFGPTGVIPAVWLVPLEQPLTLLAAGVVVGAVLLALSYLIGIVNRSRELGRTGALFAASGIAGACLYFGGGAALAGIATDQSWITLAGAIAAVTGAVLMFVGFVAASAGGAAGVGESLIELLDAVIRTATNAISFARLAAFGLTHAAISGLVWSGTVALLAGGPLGVAAGLGLFVIGNALAFSLEALVAGVQALRLEYYELFSRIFEGEGRAFSPWRLPTVSEERS